MLVRNDVRSPGRKRPVDEQARQFFLYVGDLNRRITEAVEARFGAAAQWRWHDDDDKRYVFAIVNDIDVVAVDELVDSPGTFLRWAIDGDARWVVRQRRTHRMPHRLPAPPRRTRRRRRYA